MSIFSFILQFSFFAQIKSSLTFKSPQNIENFGTVPIKVYLLILHYFAGKKVTKRWREYLFKPTLHRIFSINITSFYTTLKCIDKTKVPPFNSFRKKIVHKPAIGIISKLFSILGLNSCVSISLGARHAGISQEIWDAHIEESPKIMKIIHARRCNIKILWCYIFCRQIHKYSWTILSQP